MSNEQSRRDGPTQMREGRGNRHTQTNNPCTSTINPTTTTTTLSTPTAPTALAPLVGVGVVTLLACDAALELDPNPEADNEPEPEAAAAVEPPDAVCDAAPDVPEAVIVGDTDETYRKERLDVNYLGMENVISSQLTIIELIACPFSAHASVNSTHEQTNAVVREREQLKHAI